MQNEHASVTKARAEGRIGKGASIGQDASIGNYALIGEDASIGENASIGAGANIGENANIGARASIGEDASIGNYASIGVAASIGARASIEAGASIHVRGRFYHFDSYLGADGRPVLRYGCETHPLADWTPSLRDRLCEQHDRRPGVKDELQSFISVARAFHRSRLSQRRREVRGWTEGD